MEIALLAIHTCRCQPRGVGGAFHVFCHGKHIELAGDGQKRLGQHLVVGGFGDGANELPVYLENIKVNSRKYRSEVAPAPN